MDILSREAGNCHIKSGQDDCATSKNGVTSGLVSGADESCTDEYSTDLWGQSALQALENHDAAQPIYIHLCFEAMHTPYEAPSNWSGKTYPGMLWRSDYWVGQLVTLLKEKNMYENTLILYSSDNGGVESGNNYPLRGEKHSNWEGAMRAASFVSGGFIPTHLRGTINNQNLHIVDWYATFSVLAGIDPKDDPPVPPLPADTSHPLKNLYGNRSFPPSDSVDVWPMLTQPDKFPIDAAHPHLVLSKEVLIAGKYKLLVSQPHFKSQNSGWKQPDGKWRTPNASESVGCMDQDVSPAESALPIPSRKTNSPCLFDLRLDPGEHNDLASSFPSLVEQLWSALNLSIAGQRDCQGWTYQGTAAVIPGPVQPDGTTSCSPSSKLGNCDKTCAESKWSTFGNPDGPYCAVPGCKGDL